MVLPLEGQPSLSHMHTQTYMHTQAELLLQLDKLTLRVDDLRKKVVTSPDKLKASLRRLQVQVSEAIAATREMETQQKMWEALTSQAHQVPEVTSEVCCEGGAGLQDISHRVLQRHWVRS